MADKQPLSEEESLKTRIEILFFERVQHETADDLRTISEYFRFLSDHIEGSEIHIPVGFLSQFEAICLLLRDRLRQHPESVRNQVEQILKEEKLERVFAVLSALSQDDLLRLRRTSLIQVMASSIEAVLGNLGRVWRYHDEITRPKLFDTKIALNRLSQVVRYASTIAVIDYELDFEELKDHYDPALLEKPKLLALVNLLKVQVVALEDASVREVLRKKIDELEDDIRRPRPRWGHVIAGFFVLFSFVADLKTVSPGLYDSVYKTVQAIVMTLHQDGAVEQHRKTPLLPAHFNDTAVLPEPPRGRKEDGDVSE